MTNLAEESWRDASAGTFRLFDRRVTAATGLAGLSRIGRPAESTGLNDKRPAACYSLWRRRREVSACKNSRAFNTVVLLSLRCFDCMPASLRASRQWRSRAASLDS